MGDFRFPVTLFRDYATRTKEQHDCTIFDLAELALTTSAPTKAALPWWKLATFGDLRSGAGALRHDANLMTISGIEADYDGEQMNFDEAAELLDKLGVCALLYTSPSHAEDAPRWRVMCPLSAQMKPDRRRHMLGRLNGAFRGIFSRESWTLSQSYYYGRVGTNPSHRVEALFGHTIDQLDDLDESWMPPAGDTQNMTGIDGIVSAETREDAELVRSAVAGDGYHVEMCALAARYIGRGVPAATVEGILCGLMLSRPERSRDERWRSRYGEIPALVSSAVTKYGGELPEQRKAVARLTHRMAEEERSPDDIRTAVREEATRVGLSSEVAIRIANRILRERVEAAHA